MWLIFSVVVSLLSALKKIIPRLCSYDLDVWFCKTVHIPATSTKTWCGIVSVECFCILIFCPSLVLQRPITPPDSWRGTPVNLGTTITGYHTISWRRQLRWITLIWWLHLFGSGKKKWGHLVMPPALPRSSTFSRTSGLQCTVTLLLSETQHGYTQYRCGHM